MAIFLGIPVKDFWKGKFRGNCAVDIFEIKNGNIEQLAEAKYYYKNEAD